MYGVVLWSDLLENKAVFWCEDQGDLVFFHANPETDSECSGDFDAGDLVQFDVYVDSKLRKARNPRVILEKLNVELPEKLLRQDLQADPCAQTAEVVLFPANGSVSRAVPWADAAKVGL